MNFPIFKYFLAFLMLSSFSFAGTLGFATGSQEGTYYHMAQEIKDRCQSETLDINVFETKGSIDNIEKLLSSSKVQLGFTQADAIVGYHILNEDKGIDRRIKALYPLHSEQIHIITEKDFVVRKFSDLNGKRVGIGNRGSGRNITHTVLTQLLDLNWVAKYSDSVADDIVKLLKGELDAVFIVAGAPTNLFEKVNLKRSIRLNSIRREPALHRGGFSKLYNRDTIPARTYSFQKEEVSTYSVQSIIATYNYKKGKPTYRSLEELFKCVDRNLPRFRRNGMFQWDTVEFTKYMGWPKNHQIVEENK
jgi:TRAP transporter TAXI family solute receptor